jgi:peptidoglycan/LPS O-acetylase OafA/YrhL
MEILFVVLVPLSVIASALLLELVEARLLRVREPRPDVRGEGLAARHAA